LRCWCGLREDRSMAEIALVDTSLRDGNQSTWAAVGIDTAKTLTIAPVMDRVGFKAIDFTTSTHMGVAVRYKREDPWERIRLTAAATPNTPLQFMSTGFRFISWETASPEFMALAFEVLARNGGDRGRDLQSPLAARGGEPARPRPHGARRHAGPDRGEPLLHPHRAGGRPPRRRAAALRCRLLAPSASRRHDRDHAPAARR